MVQPREDRKKTFERFVIGTLFEFEIKKDDKEQMAKEITEAICEHGIHDRNEFQKIALGYLSSFDEKIPRDQMVAISKKIAGFW